jgi:hypothetical protein
MESVMRRIYQLSMLCLAAGVVNACKPEELFTSEDIPTAGIRFLNVVPDTGAVDFRPVDIVENSDFYNVGFRSTTLAFYKNARAGERHYRLFMSEANFSQLPAEQQIAIASTVLKDTTVTLEAGHRYTFILWGFARTGSTPGMRLTVFDDNPADPGTQVALRLVNAGAGLGAVDGRQYPAAGTPPVDPTWSAVPELSASAYVSAPADSIKYRVTAAGSAAALFTDPRAILGAAATVDLDALPGTRVPGSAVTGFVVPRSVLGSGAVNITTPGIIFLWDRRPPRPAGI